MLSACIAFAGSQPSTNSGESMSYLDNGVVRLGVDLNLGGTVTYMSASGSTSNLINNFDWGRQIQMSHYAGPVPFAPNGKQPIKRWKDLGWNPVQAGDCCGNRSQVTDHRNVGQTIYVKCIPMQWPLENEPGECEFECWFRLVGPTVQVRCRLTNHRSDKTQYRGRVQELPALYTNGPWYRLMSYRGERPFTGDALSEIPGHFPWGQWQATENWAALVNVEGWGLGIWEPGAYAFFGGFIGTNHVGKTQDLSAGYITPSQIEIVDHNIEYDFSYVLILGKLEAIRKYIYDHSPKPVPPDYRFTKDRQHWYYIEASDAGWPIGGELKVSFSGDRPLLISPPGLWQAGTAPQLHIEAAFQTTQSRAKVLWKRFDDPAFSNSKTQVFDIVPDGKYRVYDVNLASNSEYRGTITGLGLAPVGKGTKGDSLRLKRIWFGLQTRQQ